MSPEEFVAAVEHVTRLSAVTLNPREVVVVECDGDLTADTAHRMRDHLKTFFPDNEVMLLAGASIRGLMRTEP